MIRRGELSQAQQERIALLLLGKAGNPGRPAADNRLFVQGVLWFCAAARAYAASSTGAPSVHAGRRSRWSGWPRLRPPRQPVSHRGVAARTWPVQRPASGHLRGRASKLASSASERMVRQDMVKRPYGSMTTSSQLDATTRGAFASGTHQRVPLAVAEQRRDDGRKTILRSLDVYKPFSTSTPWTNRLVVARCDKGISPCRRRSFTGGDATRGGHASSGVRRSPRANWTVARVPFRRGGSGHVAGLPVARNAAGDAGGADRLGVAARGGCADEGACRVPFSPAGRHIPHDHPARGGTDGHGAVVRRPRGGANGSVQPRFA